MNDEYLTAQRLTALKEEQKEAQVLLNRLEGRREQLLERLSTEFNCLSLADAEKKLKEMKETMAEQEKRLDRAITALEAKTKPCKED